MLRRIVSRVSIFGLACSIRGLVCRSHTSLECQYRYQKLGWVGKKNQKKILDMFRRCAKPASWNKANDLRESLTGFRLVCGLMLALIVLGCGHKNLADPLQSGEVFAWNGLQGRWVGPVVPDDPSCGQGTEGLLSIGESGFGFDPFQSTTVIEGKITDDGHLIGNLVRESPDHKSLLISFNAVRSGSDAIKGQLQSGRCHWDVTLHRG
jgi:hypothetical protein